MDLGVPVVIVVIGTMTTMTTMTTVPAVTIKMKISMDRAISVKQYMFREKHLVSNAIRVPSGMSIFGIAKNVVWIFVFPLIIAANSEFSSILQRIYTAKNVVVFMKRENAIAACV